MYKDCQGTPLPVFAKGFVSSCNPLKEAVPENSVYSLKVTIKANKDKEVQEPAAGQFYMLRAVRTNLLLGRPISVYHSDTLSDGSVEVTFLILVKGKGTQELCSLREDDKIELIGPCGNRFITPKKGEKICIVGGGIGVAPVAGFAETLPPKSYDFFASFKSGSYGLENVQADKLVITTDDGSVGVHGMLPVALTEEALKNGGYTALYACGPTPMLSYIKDVCEKVGLKCYLSMESRMACGVGVCLGCVIDTKIGKQRCCKDGPIFEGSILDFDKLKPKNLPPRREPLNDEPDLSFDFKGVHFENPVIGSSGTFGFGTEYESVFDVNRLGGIASKGLTLEKREGNDGIRLHETPSGLMNSIGLQNPGIPHFIEHELPEMMKLKPVTIANLSGSSLETYVEGAKLLDKTDVPVIELNISCPNVSAGGASWGMTCSGADTIVREIRKLTKKPLIVKLTPQSNELVDVVLACVKAGADGISLCNSFQGVAIDIERGIPVFDKVKAGFGGPAVRPIAMRLIYETVEAINTLPKEERVPVFAIGGVEKWEDAVEFIMAGASAVQVGTNTFANPNTMIEVIDGLRSFMKRKGYKTLDDMRGIVQPNR